MKTRLEAIEDLPIFAQARATGKSAGDACLEKARRWSGFDADAAREEILSALRMSGRPMSGEELVDHCQRAGLVPHDSRAFGPVFGTLSRGGKIKSVGFAPRRKGHGTSGARMWKATEEDHGR